MMMQTIKRLSVGVLCALSWCAHAQDQATWSPNLNHYLAAPYLPEVLQQTPSLKLNVLEVLGTHGRLDDWIGDGFNGGAMVTTPVKPMLTAGYTVFTGTFCKPHDCGDTQWIFVYEPKQQALLLVRGDEKLTNKAGEAVREPLLQMAQMSEQLNQMWWQ